MTNRANQGGGGGSSSDSGGSKNVPVPTAPNVGMRSGGSWLNRVRPVLHAISARLDGLAGAEALSRQVVLASLEPLQWEKLDACARCLLEAGHVDDADRVFRALVNLADAAPAGHVGMALVATRRQRWGEAYSAWEKAISRAGARAIPNWVAMCAWSLIHLGRAGEALRVLDCHTPASARLPEFLRPRMLCLVMLRRLPEARAVFAENMERSGDPATLTVLLEFAAQLFDGWARTEIFIALLAKVRPADVSQHERDRPSIGLELRLLLALRNYVEFLRVYDSAVERGQLGDCEPDLTTVAVALRRPEFPDYARPKVFGVGLSRTGTQSLTTALKTLGLSALHWDNKLTGEIISDDDLPLFDAFLDTPACMNFERNYHMLPNSRFIYTVRPPAEWERSWSTYTGRWWMLADHAEITRTMKQSGQFRWGRQFVDIHMALYYNQPSYAEAFWAYDRRVRQFFADKPPERFLEFDLFAGDGWGKLCGFLGRDLPSVAFPWENSAPRQSDSAPM